VREAFDGALPARRLDDVELIVSELATNSVRHAGCDEAAELEMEADVTDRCVRVCVCDHGEGFDGAAPEELETDSAGGFGLVLLDRLADRWGTERNGSFCVWFEVDRARRA